VLVAFGQVDGAERLIDTLEEQGRTLDRPLALATAARCRGLVAAAHGDRDRAIEAFAMAIEQHARVRQPFELARTHSLLAKHSVVSTDEAMPAHR
jgi:hypothetical protein